MQTSTLIKPSPQRLGTNGFTLIEVMISLTIMAAITTLAFTGLSIALDSWDRGTKRIERLDERATIERLLKRQLALADPTAGRAKLEDKPFILFRGSSDRVEFISNYSLVDGPCDFRKIGYRFDGHALQYQEKSLFGYIPAADEAIDGQPIATLRSMRFRFLKGNKNADNTWMDQWNYGDGMPLAVEVTIETDIFAVPLVNAL